MFEITIAIPRPRRGNLEQNAPFGDAADLVSGIEEGRKQFEVALLHGIDRVGQFQTEGPGFGKVARAGADPGRIERGHQFEPLTSRPDLDGLKAGDLRLGRIEVRWDGEAADLQLEASPWIPTHTV